MELLTDRQKLVLKTIENYFFCKGAMPSSRWMATELGSAKSSILQTTDILVRKGYIKKEKRKMFFTESYLNKLIEEMTKK